MEVVEVEVVAQEEEEEKEEDGVQEEVRFVKVTPPHRGVVECKSAGAGAGTGTLPPPRRARRQRLA